MTVAEATAAYDAAKKVYQAQIDKLNQIAASIPNLHQRYLDAQAAEAKAQADFIAARSGLTQPRVDVDNARQVLQAAIQAETVNLVNQWT